METELPSHLFLILFAKGPKDKRRGGGELTKAGSSRRASLRRAPLGHVHRPLARGPVRRIRATRRGAHGGAAARRCPPRRQGGRDAGVAPLRVLGPEAGKGAGRRTPRERQSARGFVRTKLREKEGDFPSPERLEYILGVVGERFFPIFLKNKD